VYKMIVLCFSIDHMSEIVRNAIENRMKIKQELVLKQQEFLLNEVSCYYSLQMDVEYISLHVCIVGYK